MSGAPTFALLDSSAGDMLTLTSTVVVPIQCGRRRNVLFALRSGLNACTVISYRPGTRRSVVNGSNAVSSPRRSRLRLTNVSRRVPREIPPTGVCRLRDP